MFGYSNVLWPIFCPFNSLVMINVLVTCWIKRTLIMDWHVSTMLIRGPLLLRVILCITYYYVLVIIFVLFIICPKFSPCVPSIWFCFQFSTALQRIDLWRSSFSFFKPYSGGFADILLVFFSWTTSREGRRLQPPSSYPGFEPGPRMGQGNFACIVLVIYNNSLM